MNRTTKVILGVALAVILAAGGFIGGLRRLAHGRVQRSGTRARSDAAKTAVGSKVDQINALLQKEALAPPNETSATAGSIQGLLSSNGDKYATYFDATHFKAFNEETQGSFGGIGVTLGENKQGQAYVTTSTRARRRTRPG